ncbi:MAG: FumA C-terminus/TtdB family hydratase beta subunit [Candidatus Omnitrophota bacterium]
MMKKITGVLDKSARRRLKAGEEVLYSGVIYTARDQAHKRLVRAIEAGRRLPIGLRDAIIYYCGPTPSPRKRRVGSAGPTTSARMDPFTPLLIKKGLGGMIGKGRRSPEVRRAIRKYGAVYFLAIGGAGAYLAEKITTADKIAYKELGAEALYRFRVKDFPLIVGIDARGHDVYR